jgi:fucose permease
MNRQIITHEHRPYDERLIFIAACLGMLMFGIAMISLGTVSIDLQQRLGLDQQAVGSLAALLPLGILVGSIIFGPVVDRFGYQLVLVLSGALVSLSLIFMVRVTSLGWIQISFGLIGLGGGVLNGSTNALVADISPEAKGARLSLMGAFYGIGALGLPLIVGFLSRYFSSVAIVTGIALVLLVLVIYMLVIKFPEPKQQQGFPLKASLQLIGEPLLLLIGLVLFFQSGMEGIVNNWTTTYLTKPLVEGGRGLESSQALYALTFLMLGVTLMRLILGWLLKVVRQEWVFIASMGIIILCYAGLNWLGSSVALLSIMFVLGLGFAGIFPIMYAYAGQLYAHLSGTAFSVILVLALTGNTLLNFLVGKLTAGYGMSSYLLILTVCAVAVMLLFGALRMRMKRADQ